VTIMVERSYRGLVWLLAFVGFVADQASKYGVFRWLYSDQGFHQGEYDLVPGYFKFLAQFTDDEEKGAGLLAALRTWSGPLLPKVNHGALFGLGGDYQHYANGVFALVSLAAIIAIVVWASRRTTARDGLLCTALGLILAGTLGNLYDRVVFGGVRDFLYFYLINWPVFNFADCCLVCGAFLLLAQAFWAKPAPADQAAEAGAPALAETK